MADIIERDDRNRLAAETQLLTELERGRQSGESEGWVPASDVRAHFAPCVETAKRATVGRVYPTS